MDEESDNKSMITQVELAQERNRLSHLRTFLSWIRTGLAIVGGGFALARFIAFENPTNRLIGQRVGELLILLGMMVFALSLLDYKSTYQKMERGSTYGGSLWSVALISLMLIGISSFLFYIVVRRLW